MEEKSDTVMNWIECLDREELETVLSTLELLTTGSRISKYNRLNKWLLGEYSAADFLASTDDPEIVKVKRESLRSTYIAQTIWEKSGSTILENDYLADEDHPLGILINDPDIQATLEKIKVGKPLPEPTRNPNINNLDKNKEGEENVIPVAQNTVTSDGHGQDSVTVEDQEKDTVREDTNSQIQSILREMLKEFKNFDEEIKSIKKKVTDLENERHPQYGMVQSLGFRPSGHVRGPASSTRMEQPEHQSYDSELNAEGGNNHRTVGFKERVNHSSSPIGTKDRYEALKEQLDAIQAEIQCRSQLDESTQVSHQRQSSRQLIHGPDNPKPIDVANIVRKWNISFNGEKGSSVEHFLTQIQDHNKLAGLPDKKLLEALPLLLKGLASTWYHNHQDTWRSWDQFKEAFRSWYGVSDFQSLIQQEALARTQAKEEPVRNYITCLHSYLLKMDPIPEAKKQLDLIHQNMHPNLRKHIKRDEVRSINELMLRATEIENSMLQERYFRPPPPADTSILPHLAYKPSKSLDKPKTSIAGYNTKPTKTPLQEFQEKLINWLSGELDNTKATGEGTTRKAAGNQHQQGKKKEWKHRHNSSERGENGDNKQKPNEKPKKIKCFQCGEFGHIRPKCPKRSGNAKQAE